MQHPQALVIFSGGQDSTTCLIQAIQTYGRENVQAITFNTDNATPSSWNAPAGSLSGFGRQTNRTRLEPDAANYTQRPDGRHRRHRNRFRRTAQYLRGRTQRPFLLYAAIYAKGQGIRHIIAGVCETDFSGYPDCRDVFVKSMNVTLNLAMDYAFKSTPR